jgi:flagellar FliJ protein
MKRFRFPLRPVAMLREHREARAREIFAEAVHAYMRTQEELARTRARLQSLEGELRGSRQTQFRPAEAALLLADYRRECDTEVAKERTVAEAREVVQKRRAEYLEAHRQLEVVERLEEKARTAHRRETDREEQAEADDFAGRRRIQPFTV